MTIKHSLGEIKKKRFLENSTVAHPLKLTPSNSCGIKYLIHK